MRNTTLKEAVIRLLPRVQTPAQYIGGELNSVVKDHRAGARQALPGFPDAYTLGMSHHGLQVLYTIMNNDPQWACERAFTPWLDFEAELREHGLPLYGLETFTPLREFDLLGFSLQYEVCYTNILTMLDLGGIPLHARTARSTIRSSSPAAPARRTRSCSPRSSTSSSSATARRACRGSWNAG